MSLIPTLKILYALNGVVALLLYLPQIVKAGKGGGNSRSMSPFTFGGWSLGAMVTALYAGLVVGDPMFAAISIGHMLGAGTLFVLIMADRMRRY